MAFGLKNVTGGNILQGVLNNYSEIPQEQMNQEYGMYLMDGETITVGFKLVRDALIFTDKRIIFTDKQGVTGTKMRIESINLFSIVNVTMETSGFGFDDSELTYLNSLKNITSSRFINCYKNLLMITVSE